MGQIDKAHHNWHHKDMHEPMSDNDVKAIATWYEEAAEKLLEERDARLRAARDSGRSQADIVRVTGYARETVRQALNPEIRAAVKRAAAERYAARKRGEK